MRRKLYLILLGCLAVSLLLGGGAVLWVSHYMRTPEFRAEFARLMQEATGQEVGLEGELGVSVFPWLGLSARGVRLGNAQGFGPEPMLTASSLSARIRVLPLFARRLSLDMVEFTDATVSLRINAEGVGNWEALVARLREGENALGAQDTHFRKINIRGVRIAGGKASLVDEKRNQSYELSGLTLSTGRIESGKPLAFALSCDFYWPRPGLDSRLDISGKLRWDAAASRVLFSETVAQGRVGGTFLPASSPKAEVAANLSVEEGDRNLRLSGLRVKVLGADLSGELTFVDFLDRFEMRGRVAASRLSPRAVINAYFPHTIPADHQGALSSAEGLVDLFVNEEEMTFTSSDARLDGALVRGKVRLGFGDKPGLEYDLTADRLDLDAYAAALNANATAPSLLVRDLPLAYLREVGGQGRLTAGTLKLAGVSAQGALLEWKAAGGAHRLALRPAKAEGGQFSGELAASFAGTAESPVLGLSGSLRLEGLDPGQVSWLDRPASRVSGKLDLRLRGGVPKAPQAPAAKVSQVLRRATGDVSLSIAPAILEWGEGKTPAPGKPADQSKRMSFSSLAAQARLSSAPAGDADWAVQAEGSLSAVGTRPLLNLDSKFATQVRPGPHGGLTLANASLSGRIKGWFLPKRENEAVFSGRGGADFAAQTLTLTTASAQTCGLNLAGSLGGKQILGSKFSLAGHVRCQDGDPKRVLAALDMRPLKPSDRRALTRITGEADLTVSAKGVQLTNLSAQMDDTSVRGNYSVQFPAQGDAPVQQSFSLQAGALDLDRYLAAPEPSSRRSGRVEPRPAPEPLPVEELRELMLDGSLSFRRFKLHGLSARNLKATVSAKGGTLVVKPLAAEFYGGDLSGEVVAQAGQHDMQLRLSLAAKDFQAGGFMLGWAGKEYVTGKTDLFLDVGGVGATDTEVLRTLEGMAGFKILEGSYALSGSAEAPPPPRRPGATAQAGGAPRHAGTPFWQAGAKLKVAGGVFQSNDFRLEGPDNIVTGRGSFSMAEDSINVSLTANMPGVPDVPIKVFGRLKDPEMEIPAGLLINNTIKEILGIPLKPIKFFKDLLF
ncbi:MAG: AsmA family protein [Proteobacteria bacterium]|nr:AsmA family protein [Pseudomonadota bacterium]MBU1596269.1 AsmA family protein [Pseudomonadota bacterium]